MNKTAGKNRVDDTLWFLYKNRFLGSTIQMHSKFLISYNHTCSLFCFRSLNSFFQKLNISTDIDKDFTDAALHDSSTC